MSATPRLKPTLWKEREGPQVEPGHKCTMSGKTASRMTRPRPLWPKRLAQRFPLDPEQWQSLPFDRVEYHLAREGIREPSHESRDKGYEAVRFPIGHEGPRAIRQYPGGGSKRRRGRRRWGNPPSRRLPRGTTMRRRPGRRAAAADENDDDENESHDGARTHRDDGIPPRPSDDNDG